MAIRARVLWPLHERPLHVALLVVAALALTTQQADCAFVLPTCVGTFALSQQSGALG